MSREGRGWAADPVCLFALRGGVHLMPVLFPKNLKQNQRQRVRYVAWSVERLGDGLVEPGALSGALRLAEPPLTGEKIVL